MSTRTTSTPGAISWVCQVALLLWFFSSPSHAVVEQTAGTRAEAQEAGSDYGRVGYAHIAGEIDRMQSRYLKRVIDQAHAADLDTLIVHIDTDGGEVFVARDMFKTILDQSAKGLRMIALVDYRAISAGAMIAYAHEEIYIAPAASIGDIGVVMYKPDGEISYGPEKVETVVRALLTQAAELRGWDRALLLKMTARNQELYKIVVPSSRTQFVIEDDLPEFLASHPEIDGEDSSQVITYRGEDRLLTLTGSEAVKFGMATGAADSPQALYTLLNVDPATVTSLAPTRAEQTAWLLAGFAPMLAGLAMLLVMFELKTPGVGIWALLGLVCGGLFLMTHFALELINNLELALIVVGAGLLFLELVTAVGAGIIGIAGAAMLIAGLVLGFVPDELPFDLTDPQFQQALFAASVDALIAAAIMTVGVIGFIAMAPRTMAARNMVLEENSEGVAGSSLADREAELIHARGTARQAISPSGVVEIGGTAYPARSQHGAYIDAGQAIEVVSVEFGELTVRELEEERPA